MFSNQNRSTKKFKHNKFITILCICLVAFILVVAILLAIYGYRINQIPNMSYEEMLTYITKNDQDAIIAVGIIQDGEMSYTFYGENGMVLTEDEHIYEIGSITKTFTTSLLYKAINEGKISLDDSIDKYLDLPEKEYYPTIKRLITHTSGYKSYYFETQIISNIFHGGNSFYRIPTENLINRLGKIDLSDVDYGFNYSNFGISVVGAVLSEIYDEDFTTLINNYIVEEFGLDNTKVSDGTGDLGDYWDWSDNDAYIPAGGLTSTIENMLEYAKLQMYEDPEYLSGTHESLAEINATTYIYEKMNAHIGSVGSAWIIDTENNIIWHNGGTSNYNSYIGFDQDKEIAVVVLTNLSPYYPIPASATALGVKLLTGLQKRFD